MLMHHYFLSICMSFVHGTALATTMQLAKQRIFFNNNFKYFHVHSEKNFDYFHVHSEKNFEYFHVYSEKNFYYFHVYSEKNFYYFHVYSVCLFVFLFIKCKKLAI